MLRYLPDNIFFNITISFILKNYFYLKESILLRVYRLTWNSIYNETNNPLISVYIPTYNRGEILLSRAIKAVLSQTYRNFELIIADDGSMDNTKNLVLQIQDPRIRYISVSRKKYRYPNKAFYHWLAGPVIAANAALSACKGDWIARIDDDDEWTPDHLEKLLNHAISGDYEFVSSDLEIVENGVSRIVTGFSDPKDPTGIGATQTWLYKSYLKFYKYNINCWRKSYFRVNDTDLQQRIYLSGVKIGYLPEVTAKIEPRPGEEKIGSAAYLSNEKKYENFYRI